MTYAQEIQSVEAFGRPYTEYRYEPDVTDIPLITIEFVPQTHPLDDFGYSQPEFVFGDVVALTEHYEHCQTHHIDLAEELDFFQVCAMELIETKSPSGRLTDTPSWLIGIRSDRGTRELIWFEEEELISKRQIEQSEEDLNEF